MAIDTRSRRSAVINYDLPAGRVLPNPDGTIDAEDSGSLAYKYAGITGASPSGAESTYFPTFMPRRRG